MDLGIDGRVALVTGADSGIGLHTAALLLDEGARVVLTDVDAERLEKAAATLDAPADRVLTVAADLTEAGSAERVVAAATERFGAVDVLVHAAGITGAQGLFHEIDEDGWRQTLETDLFAAVRAVRAVIDGMRARGWGRVVLVASEDAVQPYPDELPYCVAKAGVLALVKGLSKTYASEGVLVNAVSPAFIETPMTDAMMDERADENGTSVDEAIRSFLAEERPGMELGRRGRPEEVAAVIGFLVSERASFVNGSNYRVDAGSVQTI
ncbi:SDR family NAD(P)-dependent oxidoreductase [Cellulomonas marina]|uniref:NAD(P)-dependent dehydrogenase, short-chain alcohol dehydrogenase family n=1 Tax=Cellulomonas marina TaxID=988821 RepID=A0A1I0YBY8_9CELL|nr:SDR family oxidoreductase [Cellulomonas marina]GIG29655.1 ketoacyl reductase [Cellulomonas marina]SFB10879.1 NAD(P)-dependent dehydrogenase, short-chain alcohol dehydrogenase family [Cellulomonas marina]